jgi:hypothetical protein
MAKDNTFICARCKERVHKDIAIKVSNRYYHDVCLQLAEDRKELMDYICELFTVKSPPMKILAQIKNFEDDYNCTSKGILLTLRYFHEILGNPVNDETVGIVPYIYEEAKQHHLNIVNANNSTIDNEEYVTQKHVRIKSPKLDNKVKITPIDISSL